MAYREESTWVVRIEAAAEFGEGYEGELDGYVWREQLMPEVRRLVAAAVLRELAALPGWRVRTGNRGLPGSDELLVHLELDVEAAESARSTT